MVPWQCFAHLVLLLIERNIVLNLVELFARIFGRCLRAYAVGRSEMLEGCALGRVRLRLMVLPPILLFRLQIDTNQKQNQS